MKVIIIKESPNIHLNKFINKVNKHYNGNIIKINCISKVDELIGNIKSKNEKLLSEINKINLHLSDSIFNDTINLLDTKISNELVFIYINNEYKIKILEEKYQTITVDKDFIFDIIEYNNDKEKIMQLINKLT